MEEWQKWIESRLSLAEKQLEKLTEDTKEATERTIAHATRLKQFAKKHGLPQPE